LLPIQIQPLPVGQEIAVEQELATWLWTAPNRFRLTLVVTVAQLKMPVNAREQLILILAEIPVLELKLNRTEFVAAPLPSLGAMNQQQTYAVMERLPVWLR
jgi:hypothetical protein